MNIQAATRIANLEATDPRAPNPLLLQSDRTNDPVTEFARSVARGLSDAPKWLDCRFLYDTVGSRIYEKITEQPEYYPTRTEAAILEERIAEITEVTGPVTLIELGSGSSVKSEHILRAYLACKDSVCYAPVDISEAMLRQASLNLVAKYPEARVIGVSASYEEAFPLIRDFSPSMTIFLGSSIGNLNSTESLRFWERVTDHLLPGDFFLLGVDLEKDAGIIEAAYNDAAGWSAAFTRNLFARMNRELGSDIESDEIEHIAYYNPARQRIEIYARFNSRQTISVEPLGRVFEIEAGEMVMTEISRKYRLGPLTYYLSSFGLEARRVFTDPRGWFGLILLQRT